jgi:hypothetical protein
VGLLARGQAMLNRTFQGMEGVAVTYTRLVGGVEREVALTGWLGNTLFAGLTEQDVSVQWGEIDVLFVAADLVLPTTGATTPHAGDRLAFTLQGTAMVFEVASPDTGEPAWRWSDHFRTRLRVHCKRVS